MTSSFEVEHGETFILRCDGELKSIHSTVTCKNGTIFGKNNEPVKSVLCGNGIKKLIV